MKHPVIPELSLENPALATADALNAAPLGICITDANGFFEFVNPAYCEFYGYDESELLGEHFTLVVPDANRKLMASMHDAFITDGDGSELQQEWEVRHKNGQVRTIIAEASRIIGHDGQPRKMTFIVDISVRKRLEEQLRQANERLEYMARHDTLTGILNRRAGLTRLEEEITRSRRYGNILSIAMFDLDAFKAVNDTHGHSIGDEVLVEMSRLVGQNLRRTDDLVRLGGEEFLIIMPEVSLASAHHAVERLGQLVAETPLTSRELTMTISAGVADFDDSSPERLLERTDHAMYQAKRNGRNQVVQAES